MPIFSTTRVPSLDGLPGSNDTVGCWRLLLCADGAMVHFGIVHPHFLPWCPYLLCLVIHPVFSLVGLSRIVRGRRRLSGCGF